jgi:hypothetical protein
MLSPTVSSIDRRSELRYQFACGVEPLSSATDRHDGEGAEAANAVVVNVSSGGACILAAKASVEPFSVLPWKFQFPNVPVRVPVLAQVRWIEPVSVGAERVRIGLLFLA